LDVTLYSSGWMLSSSDPKVEARKNEPHILGRYEVTVAVIGEESIQDADCWQLDFKADENAPPGLEGLQYRVWVSKADGNIRKIAQLSGKHPVTLELEQFDGLTVVDEGAYAVPLETIPCVPSEGPQEPEQGPVSVIKSESVIEGRRVIELKLQKEDATISTLRQKWGDDPKWWLEYEKLLEGHKELEAKLKCE
jgi:hypothetical protein